ncbi:MAG: hypothetical protein ACK55I_17530, partial [bacterium]
GDVARRARVDAEHRVAAEPVGGAAADAVEAALLVELLGLRGRRAGEHVVLGEVHLAALEHDAVRAERLDELHVRVAEADVAFPGLGRAVQAQRGAERVLVAGDEAVLAAAGREVRAPRVEVVAPLLLLAEADEEQVGVGRMALVGAVGGVDRGA